MKRAAAVLSILLASTIAVFAQVAGGTVGGGGGGGGGTPGGANTNVQYNNAGAFGGSSAFTFDATNKAVTIAGGSQTASHPTITQTQTWNSGSAYFSAEVMNITNTASGSPAGGTFNKFVDYQVGGTPQISILQGVLNGEGDTYPGIAWPAAGNGGSFITSGGGGTIYFGYGLSFSSGTYAASVGVGGLRTTTNQGFYWGSSGQDFAQDTGLERTSAGNVKVVNGVGGSLGTMTASSFVAPNVIGTNFEQGSLGIVNNDLWLQTTKGGTGTNRYIVIAPATAETVVNGSFSFWSGPGRAGSRTLEINNSPGNVSLGYAGNPPFLSFSATGDSHFFDSQFVSLTAGVVSLRGSSNSARGILDIGPGTVASLPACVAAGPIAVVSDGTAALAWGATVTGGGSTKYAVFCNGTNWTVMGK